MCLFLEEYVCLGGFFFLKKSATYTLEIVVRKEGSILYLPEINNFENSVEVQWGEIEDLQTIWLVL